MLPIDQVQLHFNPATLAILNVILGPGDVRHCAGPEDLDDFRTAFKSPKGLLLATIGHHIVFPAMTYVLIWIINPIPSIALGMILVSSCPAGHLSNFLTHLSKGNAALSVSASAVSTALAIVMTPLNFNFWGNLSPVTHDLMRTISLDPLDHAQGHRHPAGHPAGGRHVGVAPVPNLRRARAEADEDVLDGGVLACSSSARWRPISSTS
jgi:BASS family bile acid:Na+ symporter